VHGVPVTFKGAANMRTKSLDSVKWVLLFAAATALFAGCGKKDDAISQAEKKDVTKGVAATTI